MSRVSASSPAPITHARAMSVLAVLTAINFVNYIDRYVLAAVVESVRVDFGIGDADAGLLGLMFMVVYMLASPFGGWLGDRGTRKYLVVGGIALWSLATIGSGYADSYRELMATRAFVGIGEAGYATVAPSMIADLFEPRKRGRMLAYFYLAIPVGSALGYVLGGAIAGSWESFVSPGTLALLHLDGVSDPGWRLAFVIAGAPGLVFALAAALMREPVRGAMDGDAATSEASFASPVDGARRLFQSPGWRATTGGMIMMTFTLGGLAFWMPTFFQRAHGMELGQAGTVFGGVTVVAGLIATLSGGWLGDRAFARAEGGYLRVSGWGLLLGAPVVLLMGLISARAPVLALTFVAEFFLFLNTGPLNAALVGSVPTNLRSTSIAVNVLLIHALGDAVSPYIIGAMSDGLGPALAGGVFGPTAEVAGLRLALTATSLPLVIGGLWLLRGAGVLDRNPQGLAARDD